MSSSKPPILLMGQTPPPWHGQAVATQLLFDHDWPDFEIHRLRMEFSEEMVEVGRFQWKKIRHLFHLIAGARKVLRENPGCVLFYPPASAKWIPFLRDVIFLACVRPLAGSTVFIYHASGLPVFTSEGPLREMLAKLVYYDADVSLEVAQEVVPPHRVFRAKSWNWCPCAIDVPQRLQAPRQAGDPTTALFVGSLQEGKGVLEILRTAAILRDRGRGGDFRFWLVGKWFSAEFEAEVRQLHNQLQLGEMVELVGQLTGEDKWDAYYNADVFFFPTHYASEATPIVLMEALGAGLPVISTAWAGIPAMLEGCTTATLLPIRSPERYADALVALDAREAAATSDFQRSRDFYIERFLPERFIDRVAEAFRSATAATGAAVPNASQSLHPASGDGRIHGAELGDGKTASRINILVYLADQNPGHDRSFGISRMSQVLLASLLETGQVEIRATVSRTSQQAPDGVSPSRILPWGTRRKWIRLLTDHLHPLFASGGFMPDVHYFPKGYLPLLSGFCRPSVVTIHDTIIQYDEDHYPEWRTRLEYIYWAKMLKHTLREADRILTVSESSRNQIRTFMARHRIPAKEIVVTYEPCAYEGLPQPLHSTRENYVIHLASVEPHKQTTNLIRWWREAESEIRNLPMLHLIGSVPREAAHLVAGSHSIVKRPFLEDEALQAAYLNARALILPSEIEGFGLPALEAYYLGTPVCFVKGTSVEEILSVATAKGGFVLENMESLFSALEEVMAMPDDEIRDCGLKLRETYAATKVADRMLAAFRSIMRKES